MATGLLAWLTDRYRRTVLNKLFELKRHQVYAVFRAVGCTYSQFSRIPLVTHPFGSTSEAGVNIDYFSQLSMANAKLAAPPPPPTCTRVSPYAPVRTNVC